MYDRPLQTHKRLQGEFVAEIANLQFVIIDPVPGWKGPCRGKIFRSCFDHLFPYIISFKIRQPYKLSVRVAYRKENSIRYSKKKKKKKIGVVLNR
jgi:hypothetical protein